MEIKAVRTWLETHPEVVGASFCVLGHGNIPEDATEDKTPGRVSALIVLNKEVLTSTYHGTSLEAWVEVTTLYAKSPGKTKGNDNA